MLTHFSHQPRYRPLILEIDTTKPGSASDTFILPLRSGYRYNAIIEWGDGSIEKIVTDANVTHVYPAGGVYRIKIHGAGYGREFPWIFFNNTGDKEKLIKILSVGSIAWLAFSASFFGCVNLAEVNLTGAKCNNVFSFNNTFRLCSLLNPDVSSLDTQFAANIGGLFYGLTLFNQPLALNTPRATSFNSMFYQCAAFKQDLSHLDIRSLTGATNMLFGTDINDTGTTTRYDALLNSWAGQAFLPNVPFHAGSATYSAAAADARAALVSAGWTITDGGLQT